jgi:hypothetical protein
MHTCKGSSLKNHFKDKRAFVGERVNRANEKVCRYALEAKKTDLKTILHFLVKIGYVEN